MPDRLIGAEALKANLPVVYSSVIDAIDNAPTVDAVRVVHGKWEADPCGWHCSECGGDGRGGWNYCPSCGAKMDEEEST